MTRPPPSSPGSGRSSSSTRTCVARRRTDMRFGVCFMANIDEIGFFTHAESLGLDSVWVADSQMLYSDCFAVLTLTVKATTLLRIGPGTAICGSRIPHVQVAGV